MAENQRGHDDPSTTEKASASNRFVDFFQLPAPVRQLFERFPLVTYPASQLPGRSPYIEASCSLHVFATEQNCLNGSASFNPSCLKWQTYLNFKGIKFDMISSNNHSSPTGVLPFVIPSKDPTKPIPSNRIEKWAISQVESESKKEAKWTARHDAFQSLLDLPIRRAWLYHLYLVKANRELVKELYIYPSSSNLLVQQTILFQLQRAATDELKKGRDQVAGKEIYSEVEKAFQALSTLLDNNAWFFAGSSPSLFDASVFAYTHLILSSSLKWQDSRLADILEKSSNLVDHRQRVVEQYFAGLSEAKILLSS